MDFTDQASSNYSLKPALFFTFFALIYIFANKLFQKWGSKHSHDASSCLLSLFHGTPSVILALSALSSMKKSENPTKVFASKNTPFQNMVLEYSTSYFIMDLFHYFMFNPNEVIFIAHHLATLYVLLTCRFMVNHGGFSILVILVLAEVTSPLQNVWTLSRLRKSDFNTAKKLYDFLSPGFYSFYTVVRGVFAPLFVIRMGSVYATGVADSVIPRWVWGSWMVLIVFGILGSIFWVLNHWIEYYKEKICEKKLR